MIESDHLHVLCEEGTSEVRADSSLGSDIKSSRTLVLHLRKELRIPSRAINIVLYLQQAN